MRRFCTFLLLLTFGQIGLGQEALKSVPLKANYLGSDNLGNIYAIQSDALTKMDPDLKVLEKYSNKSWGGITTFDASNPMKLLAWYRDLTRIAFLDNRLSERGEAVALDEMGLEQCLFACTSHSNGIWVYDQINFELVRLDQELKVDRKTGNLAQLLRSEITPLFLFEMNNLVYLHDQKLGLLVFDIYGTYYKTIPLKDVRDLHLREGHLFYRSNDQLISLNLRTLEEKSCKIPLPESTQFITTEKRWYFLTETSVTIYSPLL